LPSSPACLTCSQQGCVDNAFSLNLSKSLQIPADPSRSHVASDNMNQPTWPYAATKPKPGTSRLTTLGTMPTLPPTPTKRLSMRPPGRWTSTRTSPSSTMNTPGGLLRCNQYKTHTSRRQQVAADGIMNAHHTQQDTPSLARNKQPKYTSTTHAAAARKKFLLLGGG
jgi:hypothetical protein